MTLAWRATGATQLTHTFAELAIRARDVGELAPAVAIVKREVWIMCVWLA